MTTWTNPAFTPKRALTNTTCNTDHFQPKQNTHANNSEKTPEPIPCQTREETCENVHVDPYRRTHGYPHNTHTHTRNTQRNTHTLDKHSDATLHNDKLMNPPNTNKTLNHPDTHQRTPDHTDDRHTNTTRQPKLKKNKRDIETKTEPSNILMFRARPELQHLNSEKAHFCQKVPATGKG